MPAVMALSGGDDDDDNDDDDSRSGDEDAADIGWGLIEAGERTGYAGATVESFTGKKEVDGLCIVKVCRAVGAGVATVILWLSIVYRCVGFKTISCHRPLAGEVEFYTSLFCS